MLDPERAGRFVRRVVEAVDLPVTVKIRKGWDENNVTAPISPASWKRRASRPSPSTAAHAKIYTGRADWDIIREVKRAVDIPVIGNGDVASPQDALRMLEQTGVDAVMIGRACLGDPWIFRRVTHYLDTGELLPTPSAREKAEMAVRHLRMAVDFKGEARAVREMRKPIAWYLKGVPGANRVKRQVQRMTDAGLVAELLQEFVAGLGAAADEPLPVPGRPDQRAA